MKTLMLAVLMTCGCYAGVAAQEVTPPETFNFFYAPMQPYKVTIQSPRGVVSVLDVPKGVFLNIQGLQEQNPDFREDTGLPRTFRGDLTVRTRRADEVQAAESTVARDIMAKSPLVISLTNAVVIVESVKEPESTAEDER